MLYVIYGGIPKEIYQISRANHYLKLENKILGGISLCSEICVRFADGHSRKVSSTITTEKKNNLE